MKHSIIPIFIPHYGCPHQCIFCNQFKIAGAGTGMSVEKIRETIEAYLISANSPRIFEVAFYGGTFTALDVKLQTEFLSAAYVYLRDSRIQSIRVSTRPDAIDMEILRNLRRYGVETIELGVQSLDDNVLSAAGRGHTVEDVRHAIKCIRETNLRLGLQIMPGLPGDNRSTIMRTLKELISLSPDFVRVYPTVVLRETRLETAFRLGSYVPLMLSEAVRYAAIIKLMCMRHDIRVIRTGLQATEFLDSGDAVVAGPYHPAFGEMVDAYLFYLMLCDFLENIAYVEKSIVLHHHEKDSSKIRGLKNANILRFRSMFPRTVFEFCSDGLQRNHITVEIDGLKYEVSYNSIRHI